VKYENFKINYSTIMKANSARLFEATTKGDPDPEPLELNEYGDCEPEKASADPVQEFISVDPINPDRSIDSSSPNDCSNEATQSGELDMDDGSKAQPNVTHFGYESEDAQEKWRRKMYNEWRSKYGKREFDPFRYKSFRANFISVMKANRAALALARAKDLPDPKPIVLNEYGDCSQEEYIAMIAQQKEQQIFSESGNVGEDKVKFEEGLTAQEPLHPSAKESNGVDNRLWTEPPVPERIEATAGQSDVSSKDLFWQTEGQNGFQVYNKPIESTPNDPALSAEKLMEWARGWPGEEEARTVLAVRIVRWIH